MWSLRGRLSLLFTGASAVVWLLVLGIQRWIGYDFGITFMGFVGGMLVCASIVFSQNLFHFYRRICISSTKAWTEYALTSAFYILLNASIYLLIRKESFGNYMNFSKRDALDVGFRSPLIFFWFVICAFIISMKTKTPESAKEPMSLRKTLKMLGGLLGLYSYLILVVVIFAAFSPLIGFIAITIPMCCWLYFDYGFKTTFALKLRRRVFLSLFGSILLLSGTSYLVATTIKDFAFIGFAYNNKTWNFNELYSLKNVNEWIRWREDRTKDFSIENAIAAYGALEKLCDEQSSDDPSVLICAGESEQNAYIRGDWKESELIALMKADDSVSNRIGVILARNQSDYSEAIREAIMQLQSKSPALTLLTINAMKPSRQFLRKDFTVRVKPIIQAK